MSMILLNLKDQSGSEKSGIPVTALVALAALVIIVAGYFLLRKRK